MAVGTWITYLCVHFVESRRWRNRIDDERSCP
jgi:hypothetical protein